MRTGDRMLLDGAPVEVVNFHRRTEFGLTRVFTRIWVVVKFGNGDCRMVEGDRLTPLERSRENEGES